MEGNGSDLWVGVSVVGCLPSTQEAQRPWLQSITHKLGRVMYTCDVSTWELEVGGSEVQDHPQLHREVKAILDYIIPHI